MDTVENATAPTGAELIAAERRRQIEVEGYTAEHDRGRTSQLAAAGAAYVAVLWFGPRYALELWPWRREAFKPTGDRVRDLTRAGALIAAAIDVELATRSAER
jgi:hypothetical protein